MKRADGPILLDAAVHFQAVSKVFPAHIGVKKWLHRAEAIPALEDVSLRVPRGEVVALMGPNGSGKSTLLKLAASLLLPDRGRVTMLGLDTADRPMEVRRAVALAFAQERSFFPRLTAYENLRFFAALDNVSRSQRRERIEWALDQSGLRELRNRLVHQFSSGMYQRLAIARALLKKPAVLLLDEPSRSADRQTAELLAETVCTMARAGTTVILATHSFEEAARLADFAVFLSRGRIVSHLRRPEIAQLRCEYERLFPPADGAWERSREVCTR